MPRGRPRRRSGRLLNRVQTASESESERESTDRSSIRRDNIDPIIPIQPLTQGVDNSDAMAILTSTDNDAIAQNNAMANATVIVSNADTNTTELTVPTSTVEVTQPTGKSETKNMEEYPEVRSMITVGSIHPRNFDGTEDVEDWLEHFSYIAECNNWNKNLQKRRLPIYFKDTAELWYRDFASSKDDPAGSEQSLDEILEGLRNAFRYKNYRSMNQSALITRMQGLDEPAATYYYDMMRLCRRQNPSMKEEEKLTHIMRGLKSGVLEKVLVLEPKDCTDLLNKLRSIEEAGLLSNQRPGYNLLLLQDKAIAKGKAIATEASRTHRRLEAIAKDKESQSDKAVTDKIDELCELVKKLVITKDNHSSNYQGNSSRFPQRGNPRYTRTIDGRPICSYCHVPGHVYNSCRKRQYVENSVKRGTPPLETPNQRENKGNE